jgi:hypothetical protein
VGIVSQPIFYVGWRCIKVFHDAAAETDRTNF